MARLKTGGRRKGTPNKSTADVRALAGRYSEAVMAELARLATQAESEAARVAACREILDRAYGKATPAPEPAEPDETPQRIEVVFTSPLKNLA